VSTKLTQLRELLENRDPVEPEATLVRISATYSGGTVPVGTSVNTLTGVVVTAHYSDGTSKTVTGYTLTGTIGEGNNTITVSYGGKKTTFTVVGVADEPDEPEKTLTSISATYSGGSVPVGTAVSALTGIKVTAHYSDGSTATVTGYTLSGSIKEGSNTVTVIYGGKTTTFTVVGEAVDTEADVSQVGKVLIVKSGVTVTKSGNVLKIAITEEPEGDASNHLTVAGATATDDGNGNVTVIGMTATNDGNGNLTVS
jgi:hypothetical protein